MNNAIQANLTQPPLYMFVFQLIFKAILMTTVLLA